MFSFSPQDLSILLLLGFIRFEQACLIEGPTNIECYTGEDALFKLNATNQLQQAIIYASLGVGVGDIAYPSYISASGNNTVNKNEKLEESLKNRVTFIGDLKKGRAWFNLSSLTLDDTNDYIVSISEDGLKVQPYHVRLNVTEKGQVIPAEGPSEITDTLSSGHTKTSMILGKKTINSIKGPTCIEGCIGDDALFMWNTTDQREILSVSWGIQNGHIANPQFINVNGYTKRVNINTELDDTLRTRVSFFGDLKKGRAWFKLSSLTANDTNYYIASITDNVTRVLPYAVRLKVMEKRKVIPSKGPPDTAVMPRKGPSDTTKTPGTGYNRTTTSLHITTPEPSSTIKAQHISGLLIGFCTGCVLMWHLFIKWLL